MSLFQDLMGTVFQVTCTMLGIDPKSNPQNIIPLSLADSPGFLQDSHSDFVFYLVKFDDADINRQIDEITDPNSDPALVTKRYQHIRSVRFIWQMYGDDGMEWADKIRFKLFLPDIQNLLAENNLSLVTDVAEPVFLPEPIGHKWYRRYDLQASFNQLVTEESTLPVISGTNIIVETDKGVVSQC